VDKNSELLNVKRVVNIVTIVLQRANDSGLPNNERLPTICDFSLLVECNLVNLLLSDSLEITIISETEEAEVGRTERGTTFTIIIIIRGGGNRNITALKVPRQCPLFLPVQVKLEGR
jgi:hypothetical protein